MEDRNVWEDWGARDYPHFLSMRLGTSPWKARPDDRGGSGAQRPAGRREGDRPSRQEDASDARRVGRLPRGRAARGCTGGARVGEDGRRRRPARPPWSCMHGSRPSGRMPAAARSRTGRPSIRGPHVVSCAMRGSKRSSRTRSVTWYRSPRCVGSRRPGWSGRFAIATARAGSPAAARNDSPRSTTSSTGGTEARPSSRTCC